MNLAKICKRTLISTLKKIDLTTQVFLKNSTQCLRISFVDKILYHLVFKDISTFDGQNPKLEV